MIQFARNIKIPVSYAFCSDLVARTVSTHELSPALISATSAGPSATLSIIRNFPPNCKPNFGYCEPVFSQFPGYTLINGENDKMFRLLRFSGR
jgi:hypothetical protein